MKCSKQPLQNLQYKAWHFLMLRKRNFSFHILYANTRWDCILNDTNYKGLPRLHLQSISQCVFVASRRTSSRAWISELSIIHLFKVGDRKQKTKLALNTWLIQANINRKKITHIYNHNFEMYKHLNMSTCMEPQKAFIHIYI